ncbi:soluble lamin-associated protein of 75 kDa isoform X1 [Meriones unguiculatus]|uniref:soluble lamin-associated protein of 75 kDa isoform X1 n=2 Tax=Meriones unguiculatus TaxID=10047 RepID=UPI000B4E88D2|nr:soluble lamin-associated protein of 75 kDa isoform X1 [Meriones unguiculatus]XP_021482997.1 soluble lamin-associated protein of 75 kDa isoform X1 [Meriones unguiculatus]XP_060241586.1 soluble lamin-associated protein of 75 kDa isoform X1 [Meriones unguiculatus]XP_060241587.1 soluble lamin-associated protein of 75 kDa isoform X1 [Meriones unguiculatus]XP_060241588.1 soluble lamin-associated protein of 75 kDa isoform X1 [Meriones unguiculatus]XP_060241589.1 soluble lamin-associated protein of
MAFPVDLLANCTHEELENSAEDYLSSLRCVDPESPERFSTLDTTIPISLSNVGFVPLYGGSQTQKVLALFAPEDSLTAVALYLVDQWWAVDDIVKTSEPSREGLKQVSTLGERVVLYVLNRIIYRKQEMERHEIPFLCHSSTDYAKILWKKGEAIGFYSVKPTGSLCASFLTQNYQLPVLDTMFIRKKYRGKDLGLHMLEDFVDSFTEDALGLRYPLSSLMYTASKQYFEKYPGDHELLWEVEGVGHWHQRIPVTRALQREAIKVTEISQYEAKRPVSVEYGLAAVSEYEPEMEDSQSSEMQIHSLKDAFASTSEGLEKTPVSTRTRSGHLKRPKIGKRFQDSEFNSSQGEDENSAQTSPTAPMNKLESAARPSESSEEFLEEEPEPRVTECEDGSSDKDAPPAPDTQPRLDRQDVDKDSALEPVNGEVMDDAVKTSLVTEEEDSTSEGLEEELKVAPFNSSGETVNLVPLVAESSKASEAIPEKTSPVTDSEMLPDQGPSDDKGFITEKLSLVSKKKTHLGSSDSVATVSNEEKSDSDFPNSVAAEFPEEPVSENLTPTMTSSLEDQGEEGAPEAQEPSAAQSSLIEVELEDVPFPQNAGQKNQSEEQSEASSEQLDQLAPSAEKAVDSSSEEIEVEAPVVDRRSLRRKAKGHKGPGKKKAKLA